MNILNEKSMIRYRILSDGSWSKHPSKNYFAGWIDSTKEAKTEFSRIKEQLGGNMELHEFNDPLNGTEPIFIRKLK